MVFSFKQTKKIYFFAFITLAIFIVSAPLSQADTGVPNIISYQGRLTDTGGNPLGGAGTSYYFKFSFWDSGTVGEGTKVWPTSSPTATTLTVKEGSFNVNIGDIANGYPDTLDYNWNSNKNVYLQIEISSNNTDFETLSPRSLTTSAPFAQTASQVNGVNPSSFGTSTPFLNTLISALSTSIDSAVMTIKGMVGQVANLFNIKDSNDNMLFTVTADGKVGVGTAAPSRKLSIVGTAGSDTGLRIGTDDANQDAIIELATGLNSYVKTAIVAEGNGINRKANLHFVLDSAGDTNSYELGTDTKLFIHNQGNVGIGTTTPSAKLDVWGNLNVGISSTPALFVNTANGRVGIGTSSPISKLHVVGGDMILQHSSNGGLTFYDNNGSDRGRIGWVNTPNRIVIQGYGNPIELWGENNVRTLSVGANVGIGTTTPLAKLDITGTAGSSDIFAVSSSTNSRLFTIGANGNVGIGRTASNRTLEVAVNNNGVNIPVFARNFDATQGGNAVGYGFSNESAGLNQIKTAIVQERTGAWGKGTLHILQNDVADSATVTLADSKVSITSTGNVGIGTTVPSAKLLIKGTADSTDIFAVSSSTNSRLFTIGANGNVGIGTTNPGASLVVRTNDISSSIYLGDIISSRGFANLRLSASDSASAGISGNNYYDGSGYIKRVHNGGGGSIGIDTSTESTAGDIRFSSFPNGVPDIDLTSSRIMTLKQSGNIGIGTTTPSAQLHTTGTIRFASLGAGSLQTDADGNVTVSSDEKLKNIQGDFTRGLSDLIKINPISYKWNTLSGYDTNSTYSGFSAQNIQLAIPEAVSTSSNGFLSLSDRPILATVINAMKEIYAKVIGFAEEIRTKKLCVGDTCITESELKTLLQNQNVVPAPIPAPVQTPVVENVEIATTTENNNVATSTEELSPVVTTEEAEPVADPVVIETLPPPAEVIPAETTPE